MKNKGKRPSLECQGAERLHTLLPSPNFSRQELFSILSSGKMPRTGGTPRKEVVHAAPLSLHLVHWIY